MASPKRTQLALAGAGTRAVLVGTGRHDAPPGEESRLTPIESAARTVLALGEALVDSCGLAPENLATVIDPADPEAMYAAIESAARAADDFLVIGYVGHGVKDMDGRTLFLATRATTDLMSRYPESQALSYARINSLLRTCKLRGILVILDCCFSGMVVPPRAGSLLLASAGEDDTALAPPGATYTEFSGELIKLLREDRPPGEALTVTRLAWRLDHSQRSAGRQVVIRYGHTVAGLVLACAPEGAVVRLGTAAPNGDSPSDGHASVNCPYPGLQAFHLDDAWCYFGREQQVGRLLHEASNMLYNPGPLLVTGGSGVGKSSLLQAGLLGSIRYGHLDIARSELWPAMVMTPGSDPQNALRRGLAGVIEEHSLGIELPALNTADEALAAVKAVRDKHAVAAGLEESRFILIVDQLEELFTHTLEEERRTTFMDALRLLCTPGEGGPPTALVIAGMRAEYAAEVAFWVKDLPGLGTQVPVVPMAPGDLRQAVEAPAARVGCAVDGALTGRLLEDLATLGMAGDTPSTTPVLPFVSHAMRRTWLAARLKSQPAAVTRLTLEDYAGAGRVRDAIADSAEEIYKALNGAGRKTCRTLFSLLITVPVDGQVTRRYAAMNELRRIAPYPRTADHIVESFRAAQMLTKAGETVWITHDILLSAWPQLAKWVAEDRADSLVRQEVRAAADVWEQRGRRDDGTLYRRRRLEQAREWLLAAAERGEIVEERVRLFIKASARSQSLSTWLRRAGVITLALLLVVAAVAARDATIQAHNASVQAHNASVQANLARQQARVATAGQLAAQSETLDDFDVGKANVLAAGAWQLDPDSLSLDAVADALQRPRQLVLRAHTAPVTGVAFADRGREVVTVGDDGNGYLWDVANGDEVGDPLAGYEVGPMPAPAVSGDGQTVATADGNYIYLWDTSGDSVGGSESADVSECLDDVAATAFSPDDSYLAVACQDSQYPSDKYGIGLNRLASANGLVSSAPGRELGNATTPFSAIAFSPDSHTLAAVNGDRTLLFTVSTGASGPVLSGDAAAVTSVEFSPDGRMLVTASKDGTARLWSAATGHQMAILRAGGGAVTAVAFSPDGSTVATASADGTARLWSTSSGAPIAMLTGHTEAIQAVAFDPREPIVVTASSDGTARVWDASTGAPIAVLRGDTGPVNAIAISPDGRTLATVSDDTTARLWDLTSAVPYTVLTVGSSAVTALAFNANGRTVAASGQDGSIRLWNSTGATVATYSGEEGPLLGVEFDSNGNVAATNGTTAEVWEPDSSAPPTPINFQPDGSEEIDPNPYQTAMANTCRCLSVAARGALVADANDGAFAVSPDGSRYADGNGLYKTATGQMVNSLGGEDAGKEWTSVAFSPDGTRLVVGNNDDTAWFYNGVTGNPIAQLGGNSPVLAAAFDPKGRTFATAEADGTIQLWNASSATPIGELTGSTSAVTRLAFSPDGETLASGSADGSVHLWNAITGSVIANLIGRTGPVSALAFDSDGVLAVGGKTGLVALWHVQVADLPSLCARIGGPVTRSEWTADVPGVAYEKVC